MSSASDTNATEMTVITTNTTSIHIDGEAIIHIEHYFDIGILEGLGLNI